MVTLDGSPEITAAHSLRVPADSQLELESNLDVLIVPGGGWGNRASQGAWAEAQRGEIPAAIAKLHQSGVTIASVCTGTMLVAQTGLLKNRPAITHHAAIALTFPVVYGR